MPVLTIPKHYSKDSIIVPLEVCRHLSDAGISELRALIYMLAHKDDEDFSACGLKEAGLDKKSFNSAVEFWKSRGIITLNENDFISSPQGPAPCYTPAQISIEMEQDEPLREMILQAEVILSKTLTTAEICTIYSFYDWLHLPAQVVSILLSYCARQGKTGIKYIEKTAIEWSKAGITSVSAAQNYVQSKDTNMDFFTRLRSLFKIQDRELGTAEKRYASKWHEYDFCDEMLSLAFDRTIKNTDKLSFPYINSILESWYNKGYKTVADISQDEGFTSKKKTTAKVSGRYDYDEIERLSLEYIKKQSGKGGKK